jgi:acetate kinase
MSPEPGIVLVLNAGSSSLKFAAYDAAADPVPRCAGQVEGIGAAPRFKASGADGRRVVDRRWDDASAPRHQTPTDHAAALGVVIDWLQGQLAGRPVVAVGHRVVHGGADFAEPLRIGAEVLAALRALVPLAPLHQPHNLAGIEAAASRFPGVPQVACFDTAFHRSQDFAAEAYALPMRLHAAGIRRYGFHGLSYEYIARRIAAEDPALGAGRLVVAHLGNGASLCAIAGGRSRATSMGFTALDGVPMGTRSGQLDPGAVLHMIDALGMTTAEVARLLYHDSGLKGCPASRRMCGRSRAPAGRRRSAPSASSPSASGARSPPWPPRSAGWTRWSSPPASGRTRPGCAPASARGSASSASRSIPRATRRTRRRFRPMARRCACWSAAPTRSG